MTDESNAARAGGSGSGSGSGSGTADPGPSTARTKDNGEGSSRSVGVQHSVDGPRLQSLVDVMRRPSTRPPSPVVLKQMPSPGKQKPALNPKEDLWLSTADDRYTSPIIPIRVGELPDIQTFYVHRDILVAHDWFKAALSGNFKESTDQALDLPMQDPAIFHFLVAFLYEGQFDPIKPIASALDPGNDKGKGRDTGIEEQGSDDDSATSLGSDTSARSQQRRERRRRRTERQIERMREKHPGQHRPECNCQQCIIGGPPCWACGAGRAPPSMVSPGYRPADNWRAMPTRNRQGPREQRATNGARGTGTGGSYNGPGPVEPPDPYGGGRIKGEDLQTWLLAYELCIEVYICADTYLMETFKAEVSRRTIDMLETAGSDAAQPRVLQSCARLVHNVGEADCLSRMVLARAGFLQSILWSRFSEETSEFLLANPDVAALMLREMAARREDEPSGRTLPSMQRPTPPPAGPNLPHNAHLQGPVWDAYAVQTRHNLRGARF